MSSSPQPCGVAAIIRIGGSQGQGWPWARVHGYAASKPPGLAPGREGRRVTSGPCPQLLLSPAPTQDAHSQRQWRTLEAVRHVGVAIVSSALTTVIATVPLFFCIIAPFAKFGKIVALNTGVSILYTLTVSTALLGIMAPGSFTRTRTSFLKALGAVLLAGALGLGACLLLLWSGYKIPLPNGTSL